MENKKELLYDGMYYDVTNWIPKHPGGKVIELYISTGEDSTLAVQQFHRRSTKKVMSIMKSLPHRRSNNSETITNKVCPEKQQAHAVLTKDFLELYKTFDQDGYFEPNPLHVVFRILEIILLCSIGIYCLRLQPQNLFQRIGGILIVALGVGRSGYVQHEAMHTSLFGIPKLDKAIQKVLCGIFMGISGTHYAGKHHQHHAMPQHVKHDVDLQSFPLIAFNKGTVTKPKDGKGFFIQNQGWLFTPIYTFIITLAWKLFIHPRYCLRKGKYDELVYMTLHYIIFIGSVGFVNYLISVWCASVYLLTNFALNHSHLPVTNEPTHWVEYSLIHTANIRSSWLSWVDYWTGNLNYQIEHHLFPAMPQYRNKLCREKVKALALKHNLPYNLYSYGEAFQKTINNLSAVSKELAGE